MKTKLYVPFCFIICLSLVLAACAPGTPTPQLAPVVAECTPVPAPAENSASQVEIAPVGVMDDTMTVNSSADLAGGNEATDQTNCPSSEDKLRKNCIEFNNGVRKGLASGWLISKSSELLTRYSSSEANHRVEKFPMKLSTGSSNNFVSGRLNSYADKGHHDDVYRGKRLVDFLGICRPGKCSPTDPVFNARLNRCAECIVKRCELGPDGADRLGCHHSEIRHRQAPCHSIRVQMARERLQRK